MFLFSLWFFSWLEKRGEKREKLSSRIAPRDTASEGRSGSSTARAPSSDQIQARERERRGLEPAIERECGAQRTLEKETKAREAAANDASLAWCTVFFAAPPFVSAFLCLKKKRVTYGRGDELISVGGLGLDGRALEGAGAGRADRAGGGELHDCLLLF